MSKATASILDRMQAETRKSLVWWLWLATWIGLLAGLFDRRWYEAVVVFSAVHATSFLWLSGWRIAAFPTQVRIAYLLWVTIGTYVPGALPLMWVTTVGLATNLFCGYCPLARMLYLLPWNREERLRPRMVVRIFTTPPVAGRFSPRS